MVAQGDVPWAFDHQPGGPGGQFPPRDRTAIGQQHFAVEARDGARTTKVTATRPAAARPPSSDAGRTAGRCRNRGARIAGPTSAAKRVSRTRGPARRAHRRPATPRPAAATTPPEPTPARRQGQADRRGSRRRRTPHGRRSAACPAVRGRAADRQRRLPAAGERPPAEGRAVAIPRPRRGPPGSAACAATVPNPRSARSSRAGTRHVGPADQAASRRTRSATARASVRPWRSSPAARRRSPEVGAARALARQAARSPSHSASMAPMRR